MGFSSVAFIFYFLPVFLAGYYLLPKLWAKNLYLFLFSLLFYAFGEAKLVVLLIFMGFASWLFSYIIAKTKFKFGGLLMGILTFAGILIYYKYLGFIIDNLIYAGITLFPKVEMGTSLGLSFYTFQAISYIIDVYRKNNRFEKNPAYVMLYITMFPQLILGPLVQYKSMEMQLKMRSFDFSRFSEGVKRFIIGLGKKVLIANQIGYLVNQILGTDLNMLSIEVLWVAMFAYAIQFLFDFSGYTDMAIGVGKMLGFDLPENFNYPYISRSITEFWRRWHMSLSRWIKDYIFNPLVMQMRYWGKAGIFIALVVTFLACGLWHGPSWNYILWGLLHGILLGTEEVFLLKYLKKLKGFAVLYTWFTLLICAVLFSTPDIHKASDLFAHMFGFAETGTHGLNAFFTLEHSIILFAGFLLCFPISLPKKLKQGSSAKLFETLYAVFLVVILLLSLMRIVSETYNPFIYFKF